MAFSLRQTVYYLSSLCAVIVPLYGEQFFRDRYHKDQSLYQNNLHVYSVRSRQEAMKQLEKYGYLECRISRRKREAPFPGVIAESQGSNSRMKPVPGVVVVEQGGTVTICNETQLREGIVRYQNKYHLNLTGILDDDTLRFMSNSRCGNKDSEEELVNPDLEKSPELTQDETGSKQNRQKRSLSDNPSGADRISMTRPWRWSPRGSRLMNLIAPKETKNPALERRQQILQEYIDKLDKEDPRIYKPVTELERKKRSIVVNNRTGTAEMFQKKLLKWRLLNSGYSTRIPVQDQRATIDLAFRMWSEVIPLKFKEDVDCEIQEIDIEIAFGRGSHQNCPKTFDGYGGEVAHSWHAGDVHFDDEENYKSVKTYTVDGLYLLKVAVHEIGHVLGLAHTNKSYSIMYAIYHKHYSPQPDFELGWEDRKEVQKLYGVCKGSFNIVFDWVRKRANNQFIYNTYFFRGNRYWMYENHANRTRFGDPLFIEIEWTTLPGNLDGYVHVWYYSKRTGVVNEAYFFKGEHYYKYDSDNDRVLDGWPRLIRTDFAAKNSSMEPIPVNIDTVYFDMRDKNIYFFKGSKVYVYDPKEPEETRGCCERIVDIREEYPAKPGAKGTLPDNLDSVYYSYKDFSMYFIKGEDVWKNELFRSRDKEIRNRVVYENKWYGKWYDICDWISDTDVDAIV